MILTHFRPKRNHVTNNTLDVIIIITTLRSLRRNRKSYNKNYIVRRIYIYIYSGRNYVYLRVSPPVAPGALVFKRRTFIALLSTAALHKATEVLQLHPSSFKTRPAIINNSFPESFCVGSTIMHGKFIFIIFVCFYVHVFFHFYLHIISSLLSKTS